MKTFTLRLHDATRSERIDRISSFVGEDASGSFGILAGHARFMTVLSFGLARYRSAGQPWQYLALPGAVLDFRNNELAIASRHYLCDDDYERISTRLAGQLLAEEEELHAMKQSLHRMEEEILKQLWQLNRASL
jgi:F-type H+-transporting ATPase subunit epsilon